MSARDDYMLDDFSDPMVVITQMGVMCDEIDRHRAAYADYVKALAATAEMNNHLDELIRELTAHADAMRNDLEEADRFIAFAAHSDYVPRESITAYDNFVKEC